MNFKKRRSCNAEIWDQIARHVHRVQGREPERAHSDRPCNILSKTGKSIYYKGHLFHSRKGSGFKTNYRNAQTGEEYWISGPRGDGQDRLYVSNIPVEIDEDVREEYWAKIRKKRQLKSQSRT